MVSIVHHVISGVIHSANQWPAGMSFLQHVFFLRLKKLKYYKNIDTHWYTQTSTRIHSHPSNSTSQKVKRMVSGDRQTTERKRKKRKILISLCPLFTRNWPTGGRLSKVYFSGRSLYCDWLIMFTYLQTLLSSLVLFPFNSIRKPLLLFNPNNLIVSD